MSIFSKLFKLFLTVVLMPLIPMALLLAYYQNRQKDTILEAHYNLAEIIAFDIDYYAEGLRGRLNFIVPLARRLETGEEVQAVLAESLAQQGAVDFLAVLDETGQEAARAARGPEVQREEITVNAVLLSKEVTDGKFYFSAFADQSGSALVHWAYGLQDGRFLYGVSPLYDLQERLAQMRIGRTGQVFLFTAQGEPLYGSYPYLAGVSAQTLKHYFEGKSRLIKDLSGDQGPLVGAYAPAAPLDIYVAVLQPKEEAFRSLYFSNLVLLLFLSAIAILAYFGALAFSRSLGEPIAQLLEAAQAVSRGNLDYRVNEEEGWGEFRDLMRAFNKMTADLKDYQALQLKNQVSEMKEQVFRAAAHDLRAPLMGLQGYVFLLSSGQISAAERAEYLARMDEAAKELGSLLEDVLAVSRVEAGLTLPQRERVELLPLVQSVLRTQEPAAQEKNLRLECEVPSGVQVWADPKLLRRIVSNLLSNAVKYTQEGFVRLSVREEEKQVILEVADSGPGLSEKECAEIFEKNRQVNSASDGFGLGLFISRQLARAHGGEIKVKSVPGQGSVFSVCLPKEEA